MSDNDIEVLVALQDNATPGLNNLSQTLINNRMAIRELATGATFLGSSFLSMGIAMKNSNQAALQGAGNMFAMVGGVMSAVGASVQFISAISKMIDALKKLQIAQIITSALSGPGGWLKLLFGLGVAGAATYGVTKAMTSAGGNKASTSTATVINNYHIAGSVVTENQLVDKVHKGLLVKGQRSNSTGIK